MYKFIKDYLVYKLKKFLILFNTFYYKYFFNSNNEFDEIIRKNRIFLIEEGSFTELIDYSLNDYGVNEGIKKTLDRNLNDLPINTDLIIYFILKNFDVGFKYLEIGASVLKNFMQVNNSIKNSQLFVYDINPVNPKYKDEFIDLNQVSKFQNADSNNKLMYFKGDIFDNIDIKSFINNKNVEKFNFIYSDALHTPEAIFIEYEHLISNNLSDNFIIYYDDLDFEGMMGGFQKIYNDLKSKSENIKACTFLINGWVGQNERPHKNGIITNLDLIPQIKELRLLKTKIL